MVHQTNYKYIGMKTKEGSTKIVNFMTPGKGFLCLRLAIKGIVVNMHYLLLLLYQWIALWLLLYYFPTSLLTFIFLWWGCWYENMNPYFGQEISVESLILSCGDMYCRPSSYCRRQQFMPVLSVHNVAGDNIMYANFDTFFPGYFGDNIWFKLWHKLFPATEYAINIDKNCHCKLHCHGN